jgi:hypothetical protein
VLVGCGFRTPLAIDVPGYVCVDTAADVATFDVSFDARIGDGDVAFLVDLTGSMEEETDAIRYRIRETIVPGVRHAIANARFAVAGFSDYPVEPYGLPGRDVPFVLEQSATHDVELVEAATDRLAASSYWGGDDPESQLSALHHLVDATASPFVTDAACAAGERGRACFSPAATPIVLLFTDAPFHDGPEAGAPYSGVDPPAPSYEATVRALRSAGARVVVIYSGLYGEDDDARRLARDTGAVDASGEPIVVAVGRQGEGLDEAVVRSVEQLVAEAELDVDAIAIDEPGDEWDAPSLVRSVTPVSADPPENAVIAGDRFTRVRPGARLTFRVEVDLSELPIPSSVRMRIAFRDQAATTIETADAWVLRNTAGDIACRGRS